MMRSYISRSWRQRPAISLAYGIVIIGLVILVIARIASGPGGDGRHERRARAQAAAASQAQARPKDPDAKLEHQAKVEATLDSYLAKRGRNVRTYLAAYQLSRRLREGFGDYTHYLRSAVACNDPGTVGWTARLLLAGQPVPFDRESYIAVLEQWIAAQPDNSFPRIRLADKIAGKMSAAELLAFLSGLNDTTHYDDGAREISVEKEAFYRLQGEKSWEALDSAWSSQETMCVSYWAADVLRKEMIAAQKSEDNERALMLAAAGLGMQQERRQSASLLVRHTLARSEQEFLKVLALAGDENPYVWDLKGFAEDSAVYFKELDRAWQIQSAKEPPELTAAQQAQFSKLMAAKGEAEAFFYLARELKEVPPPVAVK